MTDRRYLVGTARKGILLAARCGLFLWPWLRPRSQRSRGRGILLGDDKRRTVVLVWGLDLDDPVAEINARQDVLRMFDLAVLVVDSWEAVEALRSTGRCVVFPNQISRDYAPDALWEPRLSRRKAAIRHDWAPDFELDLGAGHANGSASDDLKS